MDRIFIRCRPKTYAGACYSVLKMQLGIGWRELRSTAGMLSATRPGIDKRTVCSILLQPLVAEDAVKTEPVSGLTSLNFISIFTKINGASSEHLEMDSGRPPSSMGKAGQGEI